MAELVGAAADVDMVSCRYVKGTSTKGISVVKKCASAFFVLVGDLALAVTVTASAVIVTKLLADNGTFLVSAGMDVALVADIVFTDVALVPGAGGTAGAGADDPQKSAPVPHLPFVEHYRYGQSKPRDRD